jgi:hypothetical protein
MEGGFFSENPKAKPKPASQGKTQTAIGGDPSLKKTCGRLGRFIVNVAAETGRKLPPPSRRELLAIEHARLEHGEEVWERAIWNFAHRQQGFDGLHSPWSVLLTRLDTVVAAAARELELEGEAARRQAEKERCRAWRCPEPGCGKPALESYRVGWACVGCGRPVDDAKVGEWRERREKRELQ